MEGTLLESEEDALFKQFLLQVADYTLAYHDEHFCAFSNYLFWWFMVGVLGSVDQ